MPETLSSLDPAGWPDGLRRRRDGFLVVLVGELGFNRRQVRELIAGQLEVTAVGQVTIAGKAVRAAERPLECPVCAVTRWLRALSYDLRQDRTLLVAGEPDRWHRHHHDHHRPLSDRWQRAWQLLPQISGRGDVEDFSSLSTRSISAIIGRRQQTAALSHPLPGAVGAGGAAEDGSAPGFDEISDDVPGRLAMPTPLPAGKYGALDWDELDAQLDLVCAEADAVLRRLSSIDLTPPPAVD